MAHRKKPADWMGAWQARWDADRYEVRVEAHDGRWLRYRMQLNIHSSVMYGPGRGGHWYGHSADRLARKGARIAKRLNRALDVRQARDRVLAITLKDGTSLADLRRELRGLQHLNRYTREFGGQWSVADGQRMRHLETLLGPLA